MTKRSNRTRGTRRDRMGYDLKAKAIQGTSKRQATGGSDQYAGLRPVITSGPDDWSGAEFDTATFTITATSGDGTSLTYQWQANQNGQWVNLNNGGNILGATSPTLTITSFTQAQEGIEVRCAVTNASTTTYSNPASGNLTSAIYFIVTEAGDGVQDETAAFDVVDERST